MTTPPSPAHSGVTPAAEDFAPGRPVVFRNATVLTMDEGHHLYRGADVLTSGERIAAVGHALEAPADAVEIDATGGIVMPGMIDTHRHMWQTAMRGYGADWTLTQYFVYYYLNWGKKFRPQDYNAGNLLSAIESINAGVTTTVDWSHGLQTTEYADAAVDALEAVPGRFVLAYGNIHQGAWEWATTPEFRDFYTRRIDGKGDMLGFQLAFDLPGVEGFPEKAAFDVARDLGVAVTTHAGVYNVTGDAGIDQMYGGGYMTPGTIYVHAASLSPDSYHKIAATGGYASVSTESECNAGQGYSPTWKLRKYGIPVSLSQDTSVWWSGDIFNAMRATLNADRAMEHFEAHARGAGVTNADFHAASSALGRGSPL
jgi:5-methylthioadenosine/S-adenosylhomocysteine deaminase